MGQSYEYRPLPEPPIGSASTATRKQNTANDPGKVRFLARGGEVAGAKTAFGSSFTVVNGSVRT